MKLVTISKWLNESHQVHGDYNMHTITSSQCKSKVKENIWSKEVLKIYDLESF